MFYQLTENHKMTFRIKIALGHLLVSILFALVAIYLVFFVWHPNPLQIAVGVTSIFVMMLAIDVILGPLLTLIVATSPSKKTLKFDLAVIALIQLIAYFYGVYNIAISRPVYLAYDNGLVELVQADTVYRNPQKSILTEYQTNPILKIDWVNIPVYKNYQEQQERLKLEFEEAISPAMQADLYQPFDTAWENIAMKKSSLADLEKYNPQVNVENILQQYPAATSYVGLKAPQKDMVILIDDKNKKVIRIIDLNPW